MRLPHLYVLDQPLFVTFRLFDSLPKCREFSAANVTSGRAFLMMDRLLDTARSGPTYVAQPAIASMIKECLKKGSAPERYDLHAWVIMPNHVHTLITPHADVSRLLRSLKGETARRANSLLARTGRAFWQEESYDHLVRNGEEFRRILAYIVNNPVHAGLAAHAEDYRWSSAGVREHLSHRGDCLPAGKRD